MGNENSREEEEERAVLEGKETGFLLCRLPPPVEFVFTCDACLVCKVVVVVVAASPVKVVVVLLVLLLVFFCHW